MVVFELVRGALDLLGANGTLGLGIAAVLVGVYYSRELTSLLARVTQVISIATLVLGAVGLAVVVALSMGWVSIDGGALGGVLRAVGGLIGGH